MIVTLSIPLLELQIDQLLFLVGIAFKRAGFRSPEVPPDAL